MPLYADKIVLIATCDSLLAKARELARDLNIPIINCPRASDNWILVLTPNGLELRENQGESLTTAKKSKPLKVDFLAPELAYRLKYGGGRKELLAKAIGIKHGTELKIIDATAGLGIDAFILASLGYEVLMLERSPIIAALLKDGLDRLHKNTPEKNLKLKLEVSDAYHYLKNIIEYNLTKPDIIYLDPMYPEKKKSALNKKSMRIIHQLVGDDNDASEVLKLALRCAQKRVVVKRPRQAESLAEIKPTLQFSAAGSCRYDVYIAKK